MQHERRYTQSRKGLPILPVRLIHVFILDIFIMSILQLMATLTNISTRSGLRDAIRLYLCYFNTLADRSPHFMPLAVYIACMVACDSVFIEPGTRRPGLRCYKRWRGRCPCLGILRTLPRYLSLCTALRWWSRVRYNIW